MYSFFALLADLGINNKEYQMEKVEWHFKKQFGVTGRLEFYRALNMSFPCVVHAANFPLSRYIAQLMNVV